VLEAARAPGGGVALDGEEVFRAPGDAVEGAAVVAGGDLFVGFAGLGEGAFLSEGDDEVELESRRLRRARNIWVRAREVILPYLIRAPNLPTVVKAKSSMCFGGFR